jgi:hypothetical protein
MTRKSRRRAGLMDEPRLQVVLCGERRIEQLIATVVPNDTCWPRHTVPMPPLPILAVSR